MQFYVSPIAVKVGKKFSREILIEKAEFSNFFSEEEIERGIHFSNYKLLKTTYYLSKIKNEIDV